MGAKSKDKMAVAPFGLFHATHFGNGRALLARGQLPCFATFGTRLRRIFIAPFPAVSEPQYIAVG